MANLSDLNVSIGTDKNNAEEVCAYIKQFIQDGDLILDEFRKDNSVDERANYSMVFEPECTILDNGNISFGGQGRWCGPNQFFIDIAAKFNVEIDYHDSESGSNFYHHVSASGDNVLEDVEYGFYSIEHAKYMGADAVKESIEDWYYGTEDSDDSDMDEILEALGIEKSEVLEALGVDTIEEIK